MTDRMTVEAYRTITESVEALEYRLRHNARKLAEARALVARLEGQQTELTQRLIAAHDAKEQA